MEQQPLISQETGAMDEDQKDMDKTQVMCIPQQVAVWRQVTCAPLMLTVGYCIRSAISNHCLNHLYTNHNQRFPEGQGQHQHRTISALLKTKAMMNQFHFSGKNFSYFRGEQVVLLIPRKTAKQPCIGAHECHFLPANSTAIVTRSQKSDF